MKYVRAEAVRYMGAKKMTVMPEFWQIWLICSCATRCGLKAAGVFAAAVSMPEA